MRRVFIALKAPLFGWFKLMRWTHTCNTAFGFLAVVVVFFSSHFKLARINICTICVTRDGTEAVEREKRSHRHTAHTEEVNRNESHIAYLHIRLGRTYTITLTTLYESLDVYGWNGTAVADSDDGCVDAPNRWYAIWKSIPLLHRVGITINHMPKRKMRGLSAIIYRWGWDGRCIFFSKKLIFNLKRRGWK